MRIILLGWLVLVSATLVHAQPSLTDIYRSLEFRTDEFKDIKPSWWIHDSNLIRDIFIRFGNAGYIRSSGKVLTQNQRDTVLNEIYDGKTLLLVTRRKFDEELKSLLFLSPTYSIDTLMDCIFMRSVLERPNDSYSVIKAKQYPHVDISKELFNSDPRFSFDIYLHPLEPRLVLWHTISRTEKRRSEISLFGRLGNDNLNTPFWFKGTFVYGLRYAYVDDVKQVSRDNEKYSISAGIETPVNFTGQVGNPNSRSNIFKNRKLEATGPGVFIGGSYSLDTMSNFWPFTAKEMKVQFDAEISLAVAKKQSYPENVDTSFYSIRNSYVASATLKNVGGFYFGIGSSFFDTYSYRKYIAHDTVSIIHRPPESDLVLTAASDSLVERIAGEGNFLPFFRVGLVESGSVLNFDFGTMINYDFCRKYGFVMVRAQLTLSHAVGIDIKYFRSLGMPPPWQDDNYFVPTIFFRINY